MSKAQQLVQQGLVLHRQGRLREASGLYQQALAATAGFGPAMHYLGLAMAQQGMADMGRLMVEKALASGEDHAELHLNLGQLYEQAGRVRQALIQYQRAVEQAPRDAEAWTALARAHAQGGDDAASEQALRQLLQYQPGHVPTRLALARKAWWRNDVDTTREYFGPLQLEQPQILKEAYLGFAEAATEVGHPDPLPLLQLAQGSQPETVGAVVAGADLHILDDFLPDPQAARTWAKDLAFTVRNGNYPGVQTGPLPCDELMQALADRLGWRIKWASPDNGVVRLTLADATARTDIHVDDEQAVETNRYAAVLYLTEPQHCAGGTSFWQHRASGWIKRPDEAALRAAGYADFKTFLRREAPKGEQQAFQDLVAVRDAWQPLFTLPMRFNRLVLYKGNYFHAVDSVFGNSFADGRLTRLFTFETY